MDFQNKSYLTIMAVGKNHIIEELRTRLETIQNNIAALNQAIQTLNANNIRLPVYQQQRRSLDQTRLSTINMINRLT
jgi:lipid II:glycine glycyltransferase (peptidoglycan interpeptide bridge formation enzyme)